MGRWNIEANPFAPRTWTDDLQPRWKLADGGMSQISVSCGNFITWSACSPEDPAIWKDKFRMP